MNHRTGFRLLEHTADIGIEAWGVSREQVFIQAAKGLKQLLLGNSPVNHSQRYVVALDAEDSAELLVSWLNEIIYALEIRDLAPAAFRITALDQERLQAEIYGEQLDITRHEIERQVKAATYHQLLMEEAATGWHARIYLDL